MNLKSTPIKKPEPNQESRFEPFDQVGDEMWDIKGVTLFRALGYVVGLPSFMVGTALFMLGFSLTDKTLLNIACILYSLAFIAILGRPVLLRLNPKNEKQALKIAVLSLLSGMFCYGLLLGILTLIE